uniref:Uncharacterized protein n=1 Tax=Rhizophora mucronata TaxID=61149 RepID=A0A2P2QUU2_RHIMU
MVWLHLALMLPAFSLCLILGRPNPGYCGIS